MTLSKRLINSSRRFEETIFINNHDGKPILSGIWQETRYALNQWQDHDRSPGHQYGHADHDSHDCESVHFWAYIDDKPLSNPPDGELFTEIRLSIWLNNSDVNSYSTALSTGCVLSDGETEELRSCDSPDEHSRLRPMLDAITEPFMRIEPSLTRR